jgi:hypothetical protein
MFKRPATFVLPFGMSLADFDWKPTAAEREYDKHVRLQERYQREWLETAVKELALIAVQIEQDKRDAALEEFHQKREAWYREQQEKDAAAISKYLGEMQRLLDKPAYDKLMARVEAAGRDIRRQNAEIERDALKRRGVYRGR